MQRTIRLAVACIAVSFVLATGCVWAQENSEGAKAAPVARPAAREQAGPFYHLEFVVKEMDGNKVINIRTYSTSIAKDGNNSIRTGTRVPLETGTGPSSQIQYIDIGTSFDCHQAQEVDGKLTMTLGAELSSFILTEQQGAAKNQPVIRQNKWSAAVIVTLGKPTTIFSSDDVSSKNKMQVELTATLIK